MGRWEKVQYKYGDRPIADFPAVDWVVQLDCPCDVDEYIHRSGRTARYGRKGEALLVLTPSQETPMIAKLLKRNIPIQKIRSLLRPLFHE